MLQYGHVAPLIVRTGVCDTLVGFLSVRGSRGQINCALITYNICKKKYLSLQYRHVVPLIARTGVWDTLMMLSDGRVAICARGQGVSSRQNSWSNAYHDRYDCCSHSALWYIDSLSFLAIGSSECVCVPWNILERSTSHECNWVTSPCFA